MFLRNRSKSPENRLLLTPIKAIPLHNILRENHVCFSTILENLIVKNVIGTKPASPQWKLLYITVKKSQETATTLFLEMCFCAFFSLRRTLVCSLSIKNFFRSLYSWNFPPMPLLSFLHPIISDHFPFSWHLESKASLPTSICYVLILYFYFTFLQMLCLYLGNFLLFLFQCLPFLLTRIFCIHILSRIYTMNKTVVSCMVNKQAFKSWHKSSTI